MYINILTSHWAIDLSLHARPINEDQITLCPASSNRYTMHICYVCPGKFFRASV